MPKSIIEFLAQNMAHKNLHHIGIKSDEQLSKMLIEAKKQQKLKRSRELYQINREKILVRKTVWRKANPKKVIKSYKKNYERRKKNGKYEEYLPIRNQRRHELKSQYPATQNHLINENTGEVNDTVVIFDDTTAEIVASMSHDDWEFRVTQGIFEIVEREEKSKTSNL
jgi:hypothetical protein